MNPFIDVKNLKFRFNQDKGLLLNMPDLQISKGEKVFLHGPSGCGKSTFLEILSGVLNFKEGDVIINGQSLVKMTSSEKDIFRSKNIGYIFQNFNLLPYLNIYENITLPLYLNGKISTEKNIEERVRQTCDKLGILKFLNQSISQLSVGQQQRVAVARALVSHPKLILADEPTSALDFDHRDQFLKILFEMCSEQEITLIFVSHDHSFKKLFDRSIAFNDINSIQKEISV